MDYQTRKKRILIFFFIILSILVVYTVLGSIWVTRDKEAQARASERGRMTSPDLAKIIIGDMVESQQEQSSGRRQFHSGPDR